MPVSGDTSPFSSSTSSNWVARAGGLPDRMRAIARAIQRKHPDWPLSRCIATAINAVKYSAATGDSKLPGRQHEGADVVAAHAAAAADWAAKKAKASGGSKGSKKVAASHPLRLAQGLSCGCGGPHDCVFWSNRSTPQVMHLGDQATPKAGFGRVVKRRRATTSEEADIKAGRWIRVDAHGNTPGDPAYQKTRVRPQLVKATQPTRPDRVELAAAFDPTQHPRAAAGAASGGQFVPVGQAKDKAGAKAQADKGAAANYQKAMTAANQAGFVKGLNDKDLAALCAYAYSAHSSDPRIVKLRIAVAGQMGKRGYDIRKYGALGGGNGSGRTVPTAAKKTAKKATTKTKTSSKSGTKTAEDGSKVPAGYYKTAHPRSDSLTLAATPLSDSCSGPEVTVNGPSKPPTGSGPTTTKLDPATRRKMASQGVALKDGSFPIRTRRDLRNAVAAHGRANPTKRPMVKAHITKRAKAIGAADQLPADWQK